MKLYMECYFEITICAIVASMAFITESTEGISEFFTTPSDQFHSVLVFVYLLAAVLFPLVGGLMILHKFNSLGSKETSKQLRVFIEGNKLDSRLTAMFNLFFLARRFVLSLFLVYLTDHPYFQCVVLVGTSFLNLVYLVKSKPLITGNRIELFNEMSIYICMLLFMCILGQSWIVEAIDMLGWALIAVASINMLANMAHTAMKSIMLLSSKIGTFKLKRQAKARLYKRIQNFENDVKNNSNPTIQDQQFIARIAEFRAITQVRKWTKQRKWLVDNRVDFASFPEEIEYLKNILEFSLDKKARMQRIAKAIQFAFSKFKKQETKNQLVNKLLESQQLKEIASMQKFHKSKGTNIDQPNNSFSILSELKKNQFEKQRLSRNLIKLPQPTNF